MKRLFKYILLLASVVCNFCCEKEIDLNEYTVTKIYYRTSDDKPITQSDGWNSEFDSQILADSYSTDNGGCLLVSGNVTVFGTWFRGNSSLIEVSIPLGIKNISDFTFYKCSSLTSITIPDSVTTIGEGVFCGCSSLTSVTIGDSVTTIGSWAFYCCLDLTTVYCKATTPPTGGNSMFISNAAGRKIYVPAESIEAYKSAAGWKAYANAIVGYDF